MKFAHRYKLIRATPTHAAGEEVSWHGGDQRFYFWKPRQREWELRHQDREGPKFTVEQMQDETWFEPIGRLREFIPPFPSRKGLDEFVYLTPECRLVDDVDECRAINMLLNDEGFQGRLYDFYKAQYELFHGLKSAAA